MSTETTDTSTDPETQYPEHEKLKAVQRQSQTVGEFLDGMRSIGLVLGEYKKFDGYRDEKLVPVRRSIQDVLAEYFGIDQDTLEAEKRQMLEEIRSANG